MELFFTKKYTYELYDPIDNVRSAIESILNRKWYDFSRNIHGRLKDGNTFIITHKWSFTVIRWLEQNPAYIKGSLKEKENMTIIETIVRPNSLFVIIFYLSILIFLLSIFGIEIAESASKMPYILTFPLFTLIMFVLIKSYTVGLRKRFESMMQIHPIE